MSVLTHFIRWRLGLASATTQTTNAERDLLAEHATGKRCLVEVGVWHGVTTRRLRAAMARDGVLYAIDPYPVGRLRVSFQWWIARSEVARVTNGRVEWVRRTGAEAARDLAQQLAGNVEFAFIDGDHSYEGLRADWEGWSNLIAPNGIVALHDSRATPSWPIDDAGSIRYTREVIRADAAFEVLDEVHSLTVLRKRPRPSNRTNVDGA